MILVYSKKYISTRGWYIFFFLWSYVNTVFIVRLSFPSKFSLSVLFYFGRIHKHQPHVPPSILPLQSLWFVRAFWRYLVYILTNYGGRPITNLTVFVFYETIVHNPKGAKSGYLFLTFLSYIVSIRVLVQHIRRSSFKMSDVLDSIRMTS